MILLSFVSIATYKYFKLIDKINYLELKNDDLNDRRSNLKVENEDLQTELNDFVADNQFYKSYHAENNMTVYPTVEYALLLKNDLTNFIDHNNPEVSFIYGEKKVKCKIDNFRDYFDLQRAIKADLFLKYTHLLNLVYNGDGLKHYYDF